MNLNRIQLKAAIGNIKSRNVARHLGFREEGTERESELHQRGFVDLVVYSLLKAER
jgi:ribosomal-protein-serine acetyltransferase